jgi:hypothetical protein
VTNDCAAFLDPVDPLAIAVPMYPIRIANATVGMFCVQGRETRPSVSVLLSELVPDVKGVGGSSHFSSVVPGSWNFPRRERGMFPMFSPFVTGIGGTRASRVSSAVALLGAFAGGAHGTV